MKGTCSGEWGWGFNNGLDSWQQNPKPETLTADANNDGNIADPRRVRYGIAAENYLDLLKKRLTRAKDDHDSIKVDGTFRGLLVGVLRKVLGAIGPLDPTNWRIWPRNPETMIGLPGLDNLQFCISGVLNQGIPGDFIETGVWKGGASIFMRAMLKAQGDTSRKVWVADSFSGLPRPNPEKYPADKGDNLWTDASLAISLDEVKKNFSRYGMLDDQVEFLVGWFRDTLPRAPIERIAVLRLDGDMYESTIDSLRYLCPKLSTGGYVIIDDYDLYGCRMATDDFRRENGIVEKMGQFGRNGVFWRRTN